MSSHFEWETLVSSYLTSLERVAVLRKINHRWRRCATYSSCWGVVQFTHRVRDQMLEFLHQHQLQPYVYHIVMDVCCLFLLQSFTVQQLTLTKHVMCGSGCSSPQMGDVYIQRSINTLQVLNINCSLQPQVWSTLTRTVLARPILKQLRIGQPGQTVTWPDTELNWLEVARYLPRKIYLHVSASTTTVQQLVNSVAKKEVRMFSLRQSSITATISTKMLYVPNWYQLQSLDLWELNGHTEITALPPKLTLLKLYLPNQPVLSNQLIDQLNAVAGTLTTLQLRVNEIPNPSILLPVWRQLRFTMLQISTWAYSWCDVIPEMQCTRSLSLYDMRIMGHGDAYLTNTFMKQLVLLPLLAEVKMYNWIWFPDTITLLHHMKHVVCVMIYSGRVLGPNLPRFSWLYTANNIHYSGSTITPTE